MDSDNSIVFALWISYLYIIKLINTPENIEHNEPTIPVFTNKLVESSKDVILTLWKLTFNELSVCPFDNIQLFGICSLHIELLFRQLAALCVSVKLYYPPFIVKEVTSRVYVTLLKTYAEWRHDFAV